MKFWKILVYLLLWVLNLAELVLMSEAHFSFELLVYALTIPIATLVFIFLTRKGKLNTDLDRAFWSFNFAAFKGWEKALIVVAVIGYLLPLHLALWITALVIMILVGVRLKRHQISLQGHNMFDLLWQIMVFNLFFFDAVFWRKIKKLL